MEGADPARTVRQPVNHDVASGRDATCCRLRSIVLIRIRNVQGEMEIAVRFPPVDLVGAFRSAMISFFPLWADCRAPESDAVNLQRRCPAKQRQRARTLFDYDAVRLCFGSEWM